MQKNIQSLKMKVTKRGREDLDGLVESIKEVGVIEPIVLGRGGEVISGRRRLTAARLAGLKRVPVVQMKGRAIDQQIAECDANLEVLPLGKLEFDELLLIRKQLYEKKHPESRRGKAGGTRSDGFAKVTAKRLGVSKRAIEKGVARATRSAKEVRKARKAGLSPSKVDELIKLPVEQQRGLIEYARKHSVEQIRKVVNKKRGVVSLTKPIEHLQTLLDETETLLSEMISGNIPYEMHNGKTLKLCRGTELLLKHFQAIHKERRHLRLVA